MDMESCGRELSFFVVKGTFCPPKSGEDLGVQDEQLRLGVLDKLTNTADVSVHTQNDSAYPLFNYYRMGPCPLPLIV